MRHVRLSKTFLDQFDALLEQGYPHFGERVVREKRDRVFSMIATDMAKDPRLEPDPDLDLCVYPVSRTPFVLIYDYDDDELRIHFVLHKSGDRSDLDPKSAEW